MEHVEPVPRPQMPTQSWLERLRDWRRMLPPVFVMRRGEDARLWVHVPDGRPARAWILTEDGERLAKPCAEVVLTDKAVEHLMDAGLIVLTSLVGRDGVRLARWQSLTKRLAFRVNVGWWLAHWLPMVLAVSLTGAVGILLLRTLGLAYAEWGWAVVAGLIALSMNGIMPPAVVTAALLNVISEGWLMPRASKSRSGVVLSGGKFTATTAECRRLVSC